MLMLMLICESGLIVVQMLQWAFFFRQSIEQQLYDCLQDFSISKILESYRIKNNQHAVTVGGNTIFALVLKTITFGLKTICQSER